VTGDEHALAFREQVTNKISYGVSLARTGRPLNEDPARMLELARDPDLLWIGGLAEEDLRVREPRAWTVRTYDVGRRFKTHDIQK
jgi:hypothetical protein